MSLLFEKIFVQSQKTFNALNNGSLKTNIVVLQKLISALDLKDFHISSNAASKRAFQGQNNAPCTFISICEHERFTMSVFIINEHYTMPLHDHPAMLGLLKVISGTVKIQSYSKISGTGDGELLVSSEEPKILNQQSEASFLDETSCNYHEITALNGPAAFFDVLSPPYSDLDYKGPEARHCHFYRKLMVDNSSEKKMLKLKKIECPSHYYCEALEYKQPDFMQ